MERKLLEIGSSVSVAGGWVCFTGALAVICSSAVLLTSIACRRAPVERPAPGQPSMNELMHRRAAKNEEEMRQWKAMELRFAS